jgi:hypothetical protein
MQSAIIMLAAGLLASAGCTPDRDEATLFAPEAVGVPVVDMVLIVDQPLPPLRLSRTQAPDVPYDPAAAFLGGATVSVLHRIADDVVLETVYRQDVGGPQYVPRDTPVPVVLPGAHYILQVSTLDGETITAETTTPQRFAIDEWVLLDASGTVERRRLETFATQGEAVYDHPANQLDYADGLLDARFSASAADLGAAGFQVGLFSLDPDAGFVIDPPFFEPEDFADLPRSGSSPAFAGEDRFVRLPWFAVYYDGRHLVKTYAVDRNWYDLVRTTPEGGGGFGFGGNLGDGVDPPLFHVQGGIGLFGSAAADSNGFRINPVE